MFDYTDVTTLFKAASEWQPLSHHSTQHYALKFIFGEIDAARRLHASLKSRGEDFDNVERRLKMLKMLAKTIADLPIAPPIDNRFVEKGSELFLNQPSNDE